MKTRCIALCCAVALVAAACGSRLSDDELATGGGTGGGGSATPSATGEKGAGITVDSAGKAMIGTLEVPCGKGTPKAPPAGAKGVTKDQIKIMVISDKAGQVKVPTASIEESMRAFVAWCNGFGGINGRELKLEAVDSGLSKRLEATQKACESDILAIVGSGSVLDADGAQEMVDCGLIEVPAYAATSAKALSDNVVMPLPNPSDYFNVGGARWVASQYPDAITHGATLESNLPTATEQAKRIREAYGKVGYEFSYTKDTGIVQTSYAAEAREMKDKGVQWVTMVSAVSETNKLLKDMKIQGFKPEVIDLGQQYYDPELLTEPGAEGALVQLNTIPFEEADQVPALKAYLAAYDDLGTKVEPTSLGVQAFSAGLLFAQAVKNAGDDLTRERVLAELKKIHKWDGGGMHFMADPGGNKVSTCFLYMRVKDGKFVREFPKKPGTFQCEADAGIKLDGDYGSGAKKKGS